MIPYPVTINRQYYRGKDKQKQQAAIENNKIAAELERHINKMLRSQTSPIQAYTYQEISEQTGYSEKIVSELCFAIDCGHTGFIAIKPGLTYEQAQKLAEIEVLNLKE